MNKKLRILILIITVFLLIGTLPSTTALAGSRPASSYQSSGNAKFAEIKGNPCRSWNFIDGAVPMFVCSGWTGAGSWITFPLRTWATEPQYPLANYPFYIALGTKAVPRPGTSDNYQFPSRNITYPNQIDIRGLQTEIKLVAIKQELNSILDTNFNGMIDYSYGDNMSVYAGKLTNRWHDPVEEKFTELFSPPDTESAASLEYYENAGGVVDTFILRAFSLNSSYFADNPTTYRGEPAYRLAIFSYYQVQARVTWQDYRLWIREQVGWKTVCRAGTNSSGIFNCITSGGQLGHEVTEEVYEWKWGPWQKKGESAWTTVASKARVDSVIWPDGSIHDHIPLVVYQSQPLLTQP